MPTFLLAPTNTPGLFDLFTCSLKDFSLQVRLHYLQYIIYNTMANQIRYCMSHTHWACMTSSEIHKCTIIKVDITLIERTWSYIIGSTTAWFVVSEKVNKMQHPAVVITLLKSFWQSYGTLSKKWIQVIDCACGLFKANSLLPYMLH